MTEFQINNCKILIEELTKLQETVKEPIFDMSRWVDPILDHFRTKKGLHAKIMEVTKNPCGTAACLAGKAGLIPRIRKMGFKWDVVVHKNYLHEATATFMFDDLQENEAVRAFFGTTTFQKVFLRTKIRTLNGGIRVLKRHVKDEETYRAKYGGKL